MDFAGRYKSAQEEGSMKILEISRALFFVFYVACLGGLVFAARWLYYALL